MERDWQAEPLRRRVNARVTLVLLGVVLFGYPVLFFGWYLTAEHVTARITSCPSDAPHPLRCPAHGDWRMADGSTGSGRIFVQTPTTSDVGRTLSARATADWAVAEGVTASAPGTYAAVVAGVDVVLVLLLLVLRGWNSGSPAPGERRPAMIVLCAW